MSTKYLTAPEVLNILNDPKDVLNEMPSFDTSTVAIGCFFFLLNRESVHDIGDLTLNGRVTTKTTYVGLDIVNGSLSLSVCNSENQLRVIRNTHRSYGLFNREIYYAVCEGKLMSHVLYYYTTPKDFMFLQQAHAPKKLPSQVKVIKKALENRTTEGAKNFLLSQGKTVTQRSLTSISRSVRHHIKSKQGRKAPLDFHDIVDRYVSGLDSEEILDKPVIEKLDDSSVKVRVMVGFPVAIDCYASSLPDLEDLSDYRSNVKRLSQMTRAEGEKLLSDSLLEGNNSQTILESYLDTVNKSGAVPLLGNCIMIDTTFSLTSAEYVTIILGVNETFKSSISEKSSATILAYMIHSRKKLEDHESFSMFLNRLFKKYINKKCVGLLVHDGESSFRCYNTGQFFKDAVVIRCDVHRIENLRRCIDNEEEDIEDVKEALWCRKITMNGNVVLKRGILNSLSRSEFDHKMNSYICLLNDSKLKKWLVDNTDDLFLHNSMFSKLLGGWSVQFLNTNIIESVYAIISELITMLLTAST